MTKKILKISIAFMLIVINIVATSCYAESVEVNQQNFENAVQEVVAVMENKENYKIEVVDSEMKITIDENEYIVQYDFEDSPTFTYEWNIQKGMDYDDFEEQIHNMLLPFIGYMAVANIQGVSVKEAGTYAYFSYLRNSGGEEITPVLFDDRIMSEGVRIVDLDDMILVSEFGERVIEYVDRTYKDEDVVTDKEEINSYEIKIEKQDVTEDSCKLVSTVSVNLDGDFTKLIKAEKYANTEVKKEEKEIEIEEKEHVENQKEESNEDIILDVDEEIEKQKEKNKGEEKINIFWIVIVVIMGAFMLISVILLTKALIELKKTKQ